jgi:hypothetical protein
MRDLILAAPHDEQNTLIGSLPLEREDSLCQGKSPLTGLAYLAAPVRRGPRVEAILALLISIRMPRPARVELAHVLTGSAARYSREITASAELGTRLRQVS